MMAYLSRRAVTALALLVLVSGALSGQVDNTDLVLDALLFDVFCCNDDGPNCLCFDAAAPGTTPEWDPNGDWIQDIAKQTVGIIESCPPSNGGRPYYQICMGINDEMLATLVACGIQVMGIANTRQAWCSETISYWHREAGIPYSNGYGKSTWGGDWLLTSSNAIQLFYQTEEQLSNGRGRWIDWFDLDYSNPQMGVSVPLPGAYVKIQEYDPTLGWVNYASTSHSMMIDEMTIYRNSSGQIVRIEATILEGNSGDRVKDTRIISDLCAVTPAGTQYISGSRKIVGFGIDLDVCGNPIYDPKRLHSGAEPGSAPPCGAAATIAYDVTNLPQVDDLVRYAAMVQQQGISITGFPSIGPLAELPGGGVSWTLPRTFPADSWILIDLLDEHPLPILGLFLDWGRDSEWSPAKRVVPEFKVWWAGNGLRWQAAYVPRLELPLGGLVVSWHPGVPVPVPFSLDGVDTRYILIEFPEGLTEKAILDDLRIVHDWGIGDAEENPICTP